MLGFALMLAGTVALLLSVAAFIPSDEMLTSVTAGGRRTSGGVRRQRLQRGLVVVQVAVSVVLLAGAGLLTRTTMRLSEVPTGLEGERVLTMDVNLFQPLRQTPQLYGQAWQQYDHIRDELAAEPGVRLVGIGSVMPLRSVGMLVPLSAEGRPVDPAGKPHWALERFLAEDLTHHRRVAVKRSCSPRTARSAGSRSRT